MRVLLTGATGLIGRRVLSRLLGRGDEVSVLALPETVRELPAHAGLTVVAGGLDEPAQVAAAARGSEVVVHAAGALPGNAPAVLQRVNVDGTEDLLLAVAAVRARRFVYLSSTAAYADAAPHTWPIAEDHPLQPWTQHAASYGQSKVAAEAVVTRFRRRHLLECVILRPSTVYGRGAHGPEHLVASLVLSPAVRPPPAAAAAMQWVHADDVADAVLAACTVPALGWAVCNIAGPELFDARALARVARGLRPGFTRPGLPLRYDLDRAARNLGWRPATQLRDGVREMLSGRFEALR